MPIIRYKGSNETFVFKKGVKYLVQLWGARGGGNTDEGGYAYAKVETTADATWYFFVGGSPNEYEDVNAHVGGWNGGGAGGTIALVWESVRYSDTGKGFGGGGATHLGINTNTSNQGSKLLVAAGSGGQGGAGHRGGGPGQAGQPEDRSQYWCTTNITSGAEALIYGCEGGRGATETAAGTAGRAPSHPRIIPWWDSWSSEQEPRYMRGGGGGGGGYYGGGGGSTGLLESLNVTTSGAAGGGGGSNGNGGAGGANTSKVNTYSVSDTGAGGGGGSDFYRDGNANLKGGTTYMRSGLRPSKPINTSNGVASVYPVYSEPEIRSIVRDGNQIVISFGKSLDNNEEELFYVKETIGVAEADTVKVGETNNQIVIKDNKTIIRRFNIPKEHGDRIFTFSMTNGYSDAKATYNFTVIRQAPEISINEDKFPEILIQGAMLNNVCKVITLHPNVDYRCECKLIVDDVEYTTFNHGPGNCAIHLPYLYDGQSKETYRLKLKVRAYQTAECPYGTGEVIYGDWVESKEMLVVTTKPQLNNLMFLTDLKNKALCRANKVNMSWGEKGRSFLNEKIYRLMLFDESNNLIQSFDCEDKSFEVVLDYPTNKYYKFGVSLLQHDFISEIVYSDEFYMTDIDPNSINFSTEGLRVISTIQQNFDRVEVHINGDMKLVSFDNVDESLAVHYFQNGSNELELRAYATKENYISKKYDVYLAYNEELLTTQDVLNVTSVASINNKDYNNVSLIGDEGTAVDLGITEKELSTTELFSNEVIEEVTQRITLSRKDPASLDKIHVFKILGLIE